MELKMKKILTMVIRFISVSFVMMVAVNAADIKKGSWDITYTTKMSGMPVAIEIPVKTVSECIDSDEFVPESGADGDCTHSSKRAAKGKMEWDVSCKSNGMKGHGEMIISDTTMNGHMEMKVDMMGQKMAVEIMITGKYAGACK
jgi:hypothetical protein